MYRVTTTIGLVFLYSLILCMVFGPLQTSLEKRLRKPGKFNNAFSVIYFTGLGLILWYGAKGHFSPTKWSLPGGVLFFANLLAWSGTLGLLVGTVGGVMAYRAVSEVWARGEGASGLIILFPAVFGFFAGAIAGAIIAIVLSFF